MSEKVSKSALGKHIIKIAAKSVREKAERSLLVESLMEVCSTVAQELPEQLGAESNEKTLGTIVAKFDTMLSDSKASLSDQQRVAATRAIQAVLTAVNTEFAGCFSSLLHEATELKNCEKDVFVKDRVGGHRALQTASPKFASGRNRKNELSAASLAPVV